MNAGILRDYQTRHAKNQEEQDNFVSHYSDRYQEVSTTESVAASMVNIWRQPLITEQNYLIYNIKKFKVLLTESLK